MMPLCSRQCMPTSTFSTAVIWANSRMFWNVRPMPSAVIAWGGRSTTSTPSNRIDPDVGLYTPVSWLKNVVLPAPFGPISATMEPRAIVKSMSSVATSPPNSLRSVCHLDEVVSCGHQSSLGSRSVRVPSVCTS